MHDSTVRLRAFKCSDGSQLVHAMQDDKEKAFFFHVHGNAVELLDDSREVVNRLRWDVIPSTEVSPIARSTIRALMQPDPDCDCPLCH